MLETRVRADGLKYRRKEDGSWTVEVPVEIWRRLNLMGRHKNRIEEAERAIAREKLRKQVLQDMADGLTAIASSHDLGVPVRTVKRWRTATRGPK